MIMYNHIWDHINSSLYWQSVMLLSKIWLYIHVPIQNMIMYNHSLDRNMNALSLQRQINRGHVALVCKQGKTLSSTCIFTYGKQLKLLFSISYVVRSHQRAWLWKSIEICPLCYSPGKEEEDAAADTTPSSALRRTRFQYTSNQELIAAPGNGVLPRQVVFIQNPDRNKRPSSELSKRHRNAFARLTA